MKTLIASALIASAALTGAASAAVATASPARAQIERALPGADLSGLSADQIVLVAQVIDSADNDNDGALAAKALIQNLR
ncbi:hypothetical protein [Alloyangia pacifica]|uniref:EF-hand domain-containing protein n=1 Tax=Alloyangia pacifica TaxID=311180 RepID=A0A1I6RY08_9RHOB|nr:hypothetical protein [Alloyangia pacifica]SDG66631.1 hypothetical protein SAMN04488245_1041 [Alloyangia pacifica]SFS69480.1 hypothetical protein SAMN04488050_1041 [Alloyangia pacifica]